MIGRTPWGTYHVMPGADVPAASVPTLTKPLQDQPVVTPRVNWGDGYVSQVNPNVSSFGNLGGALDLAALLRNTKLGLTGPDGKPITLKALGGGAAAVSKTTARKKAAATDPAATAPPAYQQDPTTAATGLTSDQIKTLTDAFNAHPDYANLAKQAAAMASGDVGAQVGAYRTQQGQLIKEGKQTAATILAAGKAAAGLNPDLPWILQSNYSQAADQIAAITKGLTGQTMAGTPGLSPTASGYNPATAPVSGAKALNESFGAIPAAGILQSGLSAFNEASQLPHLLHGADTQAALLAQGSANQKANALLANISDVEGQLPHLTNQYLSQLSSDERARLQNNVANALAFAKLGISSSAATAKGGLIDASTTTGTGFQTNKDGHVRTDAQGYPLAKAGWTRHYDATAGWTATKPSSKSKGGLTANEQNTDWGKINKFVTAAPQGNYTNPTISQGQGYQFRLSAPLSANDAWHQALDSFPLLFKTQSALNRLLSQIEHAYGTSFQINKAGDLTTFVGLGGGAAANANPSQPVVKFPLG